VTELAEHSPLGGSGAARWMKCPGSVSLSQGIADEESEFASLGTRAHELAEYCLKMGADAWMMIDDTMGIDKDMADAVQVYLDTVRRHPHRLDGTAMEFAEWQFHVPEVHEYFYGQADFVYADKLARQLDIYDYKHGAGIVIDVEQNAQLMYYAVGVLSSLLLWEEMDRVVLHIVQPRGFHFDGPVREWAITTEDLDVWALEVLKPAMDRAVTSSDTASGEHCRFCPARSRACPQLIADFDEMEALMAEFSKVASADQLTNEQVGRFLELFDVAKIVAKQANLTAFNRLQAGGQVPGRKLVKAKTNREWKEDADQALRDNFGDKALTKPKLKSPAAIEKLPKGASFTARYAFKPDGGQTVASDQDSRPVIAGGVREMFGFDKS
jgi:hypothetical protein